MITQTETDPRDAGTTTLPPADGVPADPRRWITLAIILTSVLIAALDSTVLNVAIPTILRDFHTTLPALQWVITGYTLTFAALLIIGGRLGDIFGARRMFIIGEAIIEGIGASLMLPATMGILSSTFSGRERATAFGAWGATMGAAVALGPLLGGFLTTNYSWRWAFRINVIVVPFAILGAVVFMRHVAPPSRRQRIDVRGALLIATGMFMLVFGISEGATYGWWHPLADLRMAGVDLWPASRSVSIVPFAFLAAILLLGGFYRLERAKEREGSDPLFEFSTMRIPAFRYGLSTLLLLAMGQIAFLFILSVFLQDSLHLSAVSTGLWLVPSGIFIVTGSQIGGRLTRRIGTARVVQIGLALEALGLAAIAVGFAGSQLTNVILADIPPAKAGAASGANTTVRMIGASLGIAVISTLLSSSTIRRAIELVGTSRQLSPGVRARALAQLHSSGVNFAPAPGTSARQADVLRHALDTAVASGARPPLMYATAVVTLGVIVSFRIPRTRPAEMEQTELQIESELISETFAVQ